jgi:hypothetical protein
MPPPRRKRPFRLKVPLPPREHAIQKQIADTLSIEIALPGKLSKAGVVWFSVDHAAYSGEVPGIRMGRGIVAGLPDLWFIYRGVCYVIELKGPNGELSEAQQEMLPVLRLAMVRIAVCASAEDVLRTLDAWAIPRHRRTLFALAAG